MFQLGQVISRSLEDRTLTSATIRYNTQVAVHKFLRTQTCGFADRKTFESLVAEHSFGATPKGKYKGNMSCTLLQAGSITQIWWVWAKTVAVITVSAVGSSDLHC